MTERGVIRLSQFINHPPAKVWKALTVPDILALACTSSTPGSTSSLRWGRAPSKA
jgi:uncharacterized protein YndB with AHSA1/START domain